MVFHGGSTAPEEAVRKSGRQGWSGVSAPGISYLTLGQRSIMQRATQSFLPKYYATSYSTFNCSMNQIGDKPVYDYLSLESNSILHTNTKNFLHGFKTSMFRKWNCKSRKHSILFHLELCQKLLMILEKITSSATMPFIVSEWWIQQTQICVCSHHIHCYSTHRHKLLNMLHYIFLRSIAQHLHVKIDKIVL